MPKGPNGEWRPNSPSQAAVLAMKIATGEMKETKKPVKLGTEIKK